MYLQLRNQVLEVFKECLIFMKMYCESLPFWFGYKIRWHSYRALPGGWVKAGEARFYLFSAEA